MDNDNEILSNNLETRGITADDHPKSVVEQQLRPDTLLIDRYLIQEVIGIGGMGSVYKARDMHFPNAVKLVAVKEMIDQSHDPSMRKTILQNFEREANILVTLNHPSIPRIFDYFSHENRSYLVEEYILGKDLEAVINETPGFIPESQILSWAIELCDVLNYLHNHKPEPIIFRDMKPSNVMVDQNRHIVLIDFGIAKIFRGGLKGTMIGTEGYSPPEQYRGEATPQVDMYALGATLHHALTKKDPRMEAPFTFSERPIRKINPAISTYLEEVILVALQYSPLDRYASIELMKEALQKAARETGFFGKSQTFDTNRINTEGLAIKPLWTFECEDEIRGTPSINNGLLYVGAYDNNLYCLNGVDGKFLWKFPTNGGIVGQPAVNDGKILLGSEDGHLYVIGDRNGKLVWDFETGGPIRSSPRIAEGHVFVGSDDGFLYAVNLGTTRQTWRLDTTHPVRSTPFITNDFIYFGSESGEFLCGDFSGQVKWRYKTKRSITSSPQVAQGTVFFSSLDSMVYALDAKTGWLIWRFRMGKGSISSPCLAGSSLFIGSADGNIYSLDASNGREIWRFETQHQVSGSPLVYQDRVFCGSADGWLYCLDHHTGRLRWKFRTGGPITGTPIVYNDTLYLGSSDHLLYALSA
jgi:outer membrane protein assembly factor BamB/tRNA A-37 threonylcarbamoyl transferase component Bud32